MDISRLRSIVFLNEKVYLMVESTIFDGKPEPLGISVS